MQIVQIAELDKKRIRIFLEDGRNFVLYKGECRRFQLQEGEDCTEEQYGEIRNEILIKRARRRVMHLLERMDHTEAQIRMKLRQGFYPEDIIEDAVSYVKGFHYLDDARYAENYVRSQKNRKSRGSMRMELQGKGIEKELIEQAIEKECRQEDEHELIQKWIEKKHYSGETADLKEKQRMYRFLMRKGFQSEDILHALDHLT